MRWEHVPGKLGIKFHLAENEWYSYVADNKHLAGIFRPPAFIRLFFTGPFPFVRFRLSVCAVSPVVSPRYGCRLVIPVTIGYQNSTSGNRNL
ncbi:hypothetical protein [uncultured Bacteroides sp.]|uniref:hypothetical protein n=1 Tax=uncultured Bacteroides sp. TaxID=162156 RepID=UPI00262E7BEF|nr:hypothetical protein [uncultured Bacteroides sp.]